MPVEEEYLEMYAGIKVIDELRIQPQDLHLLIFVEKYIVDIVKLYHF